MFASGGVLSEGYGHGGPGVCLGDGQTEAYLKNMSMTGLPWPLPGRWPDGSRRSTVTRWTRRRVAPAYVPIPDLTPRKQLQTNSSFYCAALIPIRRWIFAKLCLGVLRFWRPSKVKFHFLTVLIWLYRVSKFSIRVRVRDLVLGKINHYNIIHYSGIDP